MIPTSLLYFLTTIDTGSISRAAEQLKVAPSAVSRMIKKLESEHRTPLVERHPRGVVATESGHLLPAYTRRLIVDAERTSVDIADRRGIGKREVTIAANQSFAVEMLPHLILETQTATPQLQFRLEVTTSDIITRRVSEGAADLGVSYGMHRPDNVAVLQAHKIPIVAAMKSDHLLAQQQKLTISEIAEYPIALMSQGSTLRSVIDQCAENEQVSLHPVFTSNNVASLQAFCSNSSAITFFGRHTMSHPYLPSGLVTVELFHQELSNRHMYVQAMSGRTLPASISSFAERIAAQVTSDI